VLRNRALQIDIYLLTYLLTFNTRALGGLIVLQLDTGLSYKLVDELIIF